MASPISRKWFSDHGRVQIPDCYPIRIMQFGEGNFMRAFVDWIFQRLNDSHLFTGTIAVVQPIEQGMVEALRQQEYVYSLILRGMDDGDIRDEPYFIDVIRDGVNPYLEWNSFLALATRPELQYVVSNTTEAGIVYRNAAQPSVVCPATFPAKVAAMLVVRHDAVSAALDKGLTFLPCELIETNGEKLKDAVMRHLSDWGLSSSVGEWVEASCRFCNTLVDRIVTGYPAAEAEAIWEKLDCRDKLLVVGEYFHLWVIEGDPLLAEQLPFDQAGLNVIVTDNLKPYRDRKVRVLNGAHTGNVLAAYLAGSDTVAEMMKDRELGAFLRSMVCDEILPGVDLPEAEKTQYAQAVFERFLNPFVRHELLSISLNSVSKWKVRVLPSLKDYLAAKDTLPARLAFSLAALIVFYRGEWQGESYVGMRSDSEYPIRDDVSVLKALDSAWNQYGEDPAALARAVLADTTLWDEDLTAIPGLAESVANSLKNILAKGIRGALSVAARNNNE